MGFNVRNTAGVVDTKQILRKHNLGPAPNVGVLS